MSSLWQVAGGLVQGEPSSQTLQEPRHRASKQQRLAGPGWRGGTHEKRWVASLGSGRPSRR